MINITGKDPEARRWTNMAINNIIKVAENLQTERIS
jgi:hypothetical protein